MMMVMVIDANADTNDYAYADGDAGNAVGYHMYDGYG